MKWIGFILSHIILLVRPKDAGRLRRALAICVAAIPAGGLLAGVEALAMYFLYPHLFPDMTEAVAVRFVIYTLLFAAVGLLLVYSGKPARTHTHADAPETAAATPLAEHSFIDRITVHIGQKIKIIPVDRIAYIKADGDYVSICTDEGCFLKEQTMKHTESILNPDLFVRIHRSYIVNVGHISRIERYGKDRLVVLHGDERIRISDARYQALKRILGL